ncbi:hypothetical protein ACJMK2_008101 [Sinanodonta woodiana]|uniref:Cilia- and flagella-associated protein 74 n=1 Tax=Sinanodonta woodiana TaxID=1069815 RepID=A0ABD3VNI5_SINWO
MEEEEVSMLGGGDYEMPLLEGEEFFKDFENMENEFIFEDTTEVVNDDGELGSEEDDEEEDASYIQTPDLYPETPEEKIKWQEQIRMIHLRSHLNQLTEKVKHHQYLTEKTREELKQCRGTISQLEAEKKQNLYEIQTMEAEKNVSAQSRLRAQHDRLTQELEDEKGVEKLILERLDKEEYELAKVEVERGRFLLAEDDLVKKEQLLSKEKTTMALRRLRKEERKARQAEKNIKANERSYTEALRTRETMHQKRLEDAKRSKDKHQNFLKETLDKLKQRQEEENIRYKENMQKKMDMLLKLKSDIAANRENLKALHARDMARGTEEKRKEEEIRRKIAEEGGNPDEIRLIQQRLDTFEKQKSDFEARQKEKHAEIMQKVLIEEERMKQKKKQQPYLWSDPQREKSKIVGPTKKKPLKIFQEYTKMTGFDLDSSLKDSLDVKDENDMDEDEGEVSVRKELNDQKKEIIVNESPRVERESSDSSDQDNDEEETNVDLAKPEFEGLWDRHKPYKVPKEIETSPLKIPGASKMDKEILNKVLEKHRAGIVVKQVAAGREFTGCPFYSKPDVIHFKDFDVGKTYKKKVILTNVSYTVNYCKYLDITERLKDFITIEFDPPGQMSAGLTCEMLVTFKPMINEDLEGEVKFLSQTGPFSIPMKFSTKKCDLSVDISTVQFGTTVIGETLKKTITLTNKGALGTNFEFFKVTGMKGRDVTTADTTSLGRLTTADSARPLSPDSMDEDKTKKEGNIKRDSTETKKVSDENLIKIGTESQIGGMAAPVGQIPELVQEAYIPEPQQELQEGQDMDAHEEVDSPYLAVSEMEDYGTLDGMKVGPLSSGEIGPFSSFKLDVIWQPTVPGKVDSEFLITFSDPLSERISVLAIGNAIDVPVWVKRETVDLKICMFDRLYQDTIVVNNRATTALRLKFEVCKELKNHLELLPKTGYIQAQSQFSAQLKFLPRHSLFEEAGKYFDKETGVLEAPLIIRVADQTAPVPFTVQAVVTNSDMEFDVKDIDFGCCTIYESVKTTIKLSNKSILPQEFGFVGLPEYVEVQPNDGFGTLLPLETIELEVIFSPKQAKEYDFELNCKSLINREFKIQCKGTGVHPPLELSHQVIHFAATSLYDVSTASLHVVNSHTSTNEFTHPVPRIGKGLRLSCFQKAGRKGAKTPAAKGKAGGPATGATLTITGPKPVTQPDPDSISKDSAAYAASIGSLLRQFKGKFNSFVIPCYVASGTCGNPGETKYSIHNTLYLEVHCPIVKPPVVVISDHGRTTLNFSDISLGQNIIKSITIQNISDKIVELKASNLDTSGPFLILNALRMLPPDASHTMLVSFTPNEGRVFQEELQISSGTANLHLTLCGKGVSPLVSLNIPESGIMDMGAVLANEYIEKTFKMQNTSTLSIDYSINLESLSLLRHSHLQDLPAFIKRDKKIKFLVGTQNNNGQNVFDLVPSAGTIPPGGTAEITVTFAPDHPSDHYSDGVKVELFGKEESHSFQLKGIAKKNIMYVAVGDPLTPNIESLAERTTVHIDEEETKPTLETYLFMLKSIAKENEYIPGTREILIGCVRTMAISQKKNGEFQFENVQQITSKGFSIDPQKGMVEAGVHKVCTVTWTPPAGYDPSKPMEASVILTLKGDISEQVRIMLRAMVVSE